LKYSLVISSVRGEVRSLLKKLLIAYDTIKREKVYEAMRQMGIGEKLIRLVRMTLKETEYKLLANGQLSGKFNVKRGLRQGDPLSTVLFNVTLDSAVKASEIRGNGLIYNQLVQVMAYADDIVILTRTKKQPSTSTK
jgi:hypothetical protein